MRSEQRRSRYASDEEYRSHDLLRSKAWRQTNPEREKRRKKLYWEDRGREIQRVYINNRRASDPIFALKDRVQRRIRATIRRAGYKKSSITAGILGCTWAEFKSHIERQFLKGMSWSNASEWHLDHITPISVAETEAEVIALNHFTNLRPLWGPDNLAKRDKIEFLI